MFSNQSWGAVWRGQILPKSFQEYDMKVLVLAGFLSGSKEPSFRVFRFQKCSFCFLDVQKTLSNLDEACVKEELVSDLGGGSNMFVLMLNSPILGEVIQFDYLTTNKLC